MGRNAQVCQDAIYRQGFFQSEVGDEVAEILRDELKARVCRNIGAGIGVLVKGQQPTVGAEVFKDFLAVPAAAKGGVYVDAIGLDVKAFHAGLQQNGFMVTHLYPH